MESSNLLEKAVKGDPNSISKIVDQYTPLVHKIVQQYVWMVPDHSREDLVQEGLIGVVKAIETFDLKRNTQFMTWVYPQVRGAVQGYARKGHRHPKYNLSLAHSDWSRNLEDPQSYELREDFAQNFIKELVIAGCGSLDTQRARIVCDRFGLLGKSPMRQGEVARKYGMTKQAINSHIARFSKIVKAKHPELRELIA